MSDEFLDHDVGKPRKKKRDSTLKFTPKDGLLIDKGARNASGMSASSYRVMMPVYLMVNKGVPKLVVAESAAEFGVVLEALMDPDLYNLECQPLTVHWRDEHGQKRRHTWDIRLTFRDGRRRLVYVKGARRLRDSATRDLLQEIVRHTPPQAANDYIVVNADQYHQIRVRNLNRMYLAYREPDPIADEKVLEAALRLPKLWRLKELCTAAPLPMGVAMNACFRLIAAKKLAVNLDHILCEYSTVRLAS